MIPKICCFLQSWITLSHYDGFPLRMVRVHSGLSTLKFLLVWGRHLSHGKSSNIIETVPLCYSHDIFVGRWRNASRNNIIAAEPFKNNILHHIQDDRRVKYHMRLSFSKTWVLHCLLKNEVSTIWKIADIIWYWKIIFIVSVNSLFKHKHLH